jgi:DNA-binding LacI/PurR family transcriptional regulator
LIRLPEGGITKAALRVAVLASEIEDFNENFVASLPHELEEAGHVPVNPGKSMHDLKMDVGRIARLVEETAADAWVVVAGSREVLEWFSAQELPAFALFGRRTGLPIAGTGPDNLTPFMVATRRLIALGHRRIVAICRRERRLPSPGNAERALLNELAKHGIPRANTTCRIGRRPARVCRNYRDRFSRPLHRRR